MAEQAEVKDRKPEGTLATLAVKDILNNPHRPNELFVWNEEKLLGLKESMLTEGFWSNVEVTADKWGAVYIAGGGHHRIETLRRLIEEGLADKIRGLFKVEDEWCVKVVKKKYSPEQMLKMFMLENADAWGTDNEQNVCMMVEQVKNYLDGILASCDDHEEFIELVKSPHPLQVDERSFSRLKNQGYVGASTLHQYVGENTWSRQSIQEGLSVISQKGPAGDKLRELAKKLPNVAMANRFRLLMTEELEGEKVLSAADDQAKAGKIIEREALSRADLEKANKIKKDQDMSPLAALNEVVKEKVEAKKAETSEAAAGKTKPDQKKVKPAELAFIALKNLNTALNAMTKAEDSWSKSQKTQAKKVLREIADSMKILTK